MPPFLGENAVLIANPAAAGGKVGRRWGELSAQLSAALGPGLHVYRTEGPRHAITLARDAVKAGFTTVISLGGDGTHSEVTNGILQAEPPPGAVSLGVLPGGTGGDLRRVLSHGQSFESALARLTTAPSAPIDCGALSWRGDSGQTERGYFLNVASFGIGGLVDRIVNGSSKSLPGGVVFYTATLRALYRYRPAMVKLRLDGVELEPVPVTNVLVCNSRFAGGGMMFAPDAKLDDGLFDVVIMRQKSVWHTVSLSNAMYTGDHLKDQTVSVHRAREIVAETIGPDPAWMDIDGEAPGTLPATLRVLPGAIRLIDPQPQVLMNPLR
jgi:YegS/Rv2252/BmrU family lipid kinase